MPDTSPADRAARLSEDIARQLVRRIDAGEYAVGDRLPPERQLVEDFGASRAVIREALRSLAARGLIESYVGRGTFVRRPTTADLTERLQHLLAGSSQPHEVREGRLIVEGELAACAARNHTAQTLDAVQKAIVSGRRSERYFDALALAAHCPVLAPILAALYALEPDTDRYEEARALRRLLAALRKGDDNAARAAVRSRGRKLEADPRC